MSADAKLWPKESGNDTNYNILWEGWTTDFKGEWVQLSGETLHDTMQNEHLQRMDFWTIKQDSKGNLYLAGRKS